MVVKIIRGGRAKNRKAPYKKTFQKSKRVYVGNLSYETEWQGLKDYMREAGSVSHADVLTYEDGKSKGCGIVEFDTAKGARKAIADLNDTDLDGRTILVREDRESASFTGNGTSFTGGAKAGERVYVGNLSYETEWQDLKDYMRRAGSVSHADVLKYEDGKSKGCGIVEFETAKGARRAIASLNDTYLGGRPIFVREDREPTSFTGNARAGGRGSSFGEPVFSPNCNMAKKIRNNAKPGCVVYVGNLPWSAVWQDVKDLCSKFGTIDRADVEEYNGRSKGYGIVVFQSKATARKCIQKLNGATFQDRELVVKLDEENN